MGAVVKLIEKKFCRVCGEDKPSADFDKYRGKNADASDKCRECRSAITKEKNKRYLDKVRSDPERHAQLKANKKQFNSSVKYYDNYFMKKFGVTYEEVKAMFDAQFGRCANRGCGKDIVFYHENKDGRAHPNRACLDHDHSTGKVRALLCMPCNTILGTLETKENIVLGLLEYGYKFNPIKNSRLFNLTEKME